MKKLLKCIITSMFIGILWMFAIISFANFNTEDSHPPVFTESAIPLSEVRATDEAIASVRITSGEYDVTKTEYNTFNNKSYEFENFSYTSTTYTMYIDFVDPTIVTKLVITHNSVKQEYTQDSSSFEGFSLNYDYTDKDNPDTMSLTVTTTKNYTYGIKITREIPDSNTALGSVSIIANRGEEEFVVCNSFTSSSLTIVYPEGTTALPCTYTSLKVEATPASAKSTVEIRIDNIIGNTYTFPSTETEILNDISVGITIKVTAQDNSTKIYSGTIVRAKADENRNITITDETYIYLDPQGREQTGTFTLELIERTTESGTTEIVNISNPNSLMQFSTIKVSFKIVPESATTKVYIDGDDYTNAIYETEIENTLSNKSKRLNLSIKSEKDEILRPNNPTAGGFSTSIDLTSANPETTRTIDSITLKHSMDNSIISDASNTTIIDKAYSYVLKKSVVGENFKIDLRWNGQYTKAYLSTTNSSDIMIPDNLYDADKTWNIGTDIYIYLRAQSEEYEIYTISSEFADERSTENGIADVVFKNGDTPLGISFVETTTDYSGMEVPFSVQELTVEITLKDKGETLFHGESYLYETPDESLKVILTVSLKEGLNVFYVQGISEKEEKGTCYSFSITRNSGSTENFMESLSINGIDCTSTSIIGTSFDKVFSKENLKFSFYAPRGTNTFSFAVDVSSNATFTITPSLAKTNSYIVADGTFQEFSITVKSEVESITGIGAGQTYTIRIYVADTDNHLDDLKVYNTLDTSDELMDKNGDALLFNKDIALQSTFHLPFKVKKGYFLPIKNDFNGKISLGTEEFTNSTNRYLMEFTELKSQLDIIVKSELDVLADGDDSINDHSFTYSLPVEREVGRTNIYLQSLSVDIDGTPATFSKQQVEQEFNKEVWGPYVVEYVSKEAQQLVIHAIPEDSAATIKEELTRTIQLSDTTISQIFEITVIAEDEKTMQTYTVQLWITRENPDQNNTIQSITATTVINVSKNILTPTFTIDNTQYQVNVSAEDDISFFIQKQSKYSKIYVHDGSTAYEVTSENGMYSIMSLPSNTEKNYKIYAISEAGVKGTEYNILVKKAADTNATLKELSVNGTPVDGFTAGMTGEEFRILMGNVKDVTIVATPLKDNATLTALQNPYTLVTGENRINVVVTAEDGVTTETYTLLLVLDAEAKLDGIEVLATEEGQEVDKLQPNFNSDTFTGYSVSLAYAQDTVSIQYESEYNTASVITPDLLEITSETKVLSLSNISVGTAVYKVRVKTASGVEADYEITITRAAANTDATLKDFKINGETVTGFTAGMTSHSFEVFIKDADTVYLEGVLTDPNASISSNPCETPVDVVVGDNEFVLTTVAEDGITTETYVVKAIKDAPKTLDTLSIKLNNAEQILNFDSNTFSYPIALAYDEEELVLDFRRTNEDLTTFKVLDPEEQEINPVDGIYTLRNIKVNRSTYKIRITAQSGEYQDYDLIVTRDPGSEINTIESFKYFVHPSDTNLVDLPIQTTETTYSYIVDRTTTEFNPTITLTDEKATIEMPIDKSLIAGQANIKEVLVRSENGKERTYTFVVYPCDTDYRIEDIFVQTSDGTANLLGIDDSYIDYKNNQLSIMVASDVTSMNLKVVKSNENAVIYVNDLVLSNSVFSLEDGDNTFKIYAKSEYGIANPEDETAKSEEVTITITRVVNPVITISTQGKKEGATSTNETIPYGESKSYSFNEEGYTIQSVTIDGIAQEIKETYEFTNLIENHTIVVVYEINTYKISISVSSGKGGAYIGSDKVEEISYTYGESITFTFVPDEGYLLKRITLDGVNAGAHDSLSVGISGNHSIVLVFEIVKYSISLDVEGQGTITPETNELEYGSSITYQFRPNVGYQVKEVFVDEVSLGNITSYTISQIKKDYQIRVLFEQEKYTITVIESGNGTVTPNGDLEYSFGENALYRFIPSTGYHVASLSIDNVSIVDSELEEIIKNGYNFENIITSHTIVVMFEINTYKIEVIQTENGTISEALEVYEYGTEATFTITPDLACHIQYLLIDDVRVNPSETYTFTNIDKDHKISAVFEGDESSYKIYHHFQMIGSENYDEHLIEEVTAKVNDSIQYYAPRTAGFEAQPVAPITVKPNGESEIHVYYDRLSYTVSYVEHNGVSSVTGFGEYPFGSDVEIYAEFKQGYRWNKFISSDESLVESSENNPYQFIMPAGNVVFTFDLTSYHTIEIRPTKNGTMDKEAGIYEFNSGEDFTIHFSAMEGYQLKQILIDGLPITESQEDSYTFSNVLANHSFEVEFEQIMFTLSITIHGTTATFNEEHTIPYGSNYLYTITPIDGYDLINMNVDGTDLGPITEYEFNNVKDNHEILIEIEQILYEIMVNITGNGSVSPRGKNYVTFGSDRVLTFLPETGYYIKNVIIDKQEYGSIETYTFSRVTNDHLVEVEFEQLMYSIHINTPENGNILYEGELDLPFGSNKQLIFSPNEGYRIKDVKINNVSIGTPPNYTFINLQANQEVVVEFEQIYFTIEVNSSGHGIIDPDTTCLVPYGSTKKFEIVAELGYKISRLEVDGRSIEIQEEYTFENIMEDHSILVEFEQLIYSITIDVIGNGTINSDLHTEVFFGANKEIILTPNYGQRIKRIEVDGEVIENSNSILLNNIRKDYEITIEFEQIYFSIEATSTGHGTVTPSSSIQVPYGDNETYAFIPEDGYKIKEVVIDGKVVETNGSYTFYNVTSNHTIAVEFEELLHNIRVICGENGTSNLPEMNVLAHRSNLMCRFTPNEGYRLKDILVDGDSVGGDSTSYYFGNISTDHTIEAVFEEILLSLTVHFGPEGSVTYPGEEGPIIPTDKISVRVGTNFVLNITPATDYVAKIMINGEKVETTGQLEFTDIQMDYFIQVEFVQLLHLEISKEGNGTVPESTSYEWKTPVTLVFKPDIGNRVKEILIDGKSVGSVEDYSFPNLVANHEVKVIFEPLQYRVNYTIYGRGTVTSEMNLRTIQYGENCDLSIMADEGWQLSIVFVDGVETKVKDGKLIIEKVDQDVEIVVYFTEIPERSIPLWIFMVLGAIILILLILLIVISIWNKKRRLYRYSK